MPEHIGGSAGGSSAATRSRLLAVAAGLGLAALLAGCGAGQITQTSGQAPAVNGASGQAGAIALRDVELAHPNNCAGTYQPGTSAPLVISIVNTGLSTDTLTGVSTPAALGVTIDGSATGTRSIPGGFALVSATDVDGLGSPVVNGDEASTPEATATTEATAAPTSTVAGVAGASATSSTKPAQQGAVTTTTGTAATPTTTTTAAAAPAPSKVSIVLTGIKSVNGSALRAGLTIPVTFYFANAGAVTINVPMEAMPDSMFASCRVSASSAAHS